MLMRISNFLTSKWWVICLVILGVSILIAGMRRRRHAGAP
jgi:type II secretory pathway component PulF